MTNFMQHASRLAMIAVLGAAPLAATAQDATKPASEEATAEAPQTDEATQSSEATASGDAVEAETDTDTAEAPEGDAELEADIATAPDTDAATDSAEASATSEPISEDTAEAPATEPLGDTVAPADTTAEAPAEEPAKPVEGQITMQSENTILADDLIGSNVYSDAGEKIGDVDDLIVNLDGTVEGVVIGVGGFLGMGEKWVAVKMDSLSTMTDESGTLRLVSSATKTDLEAAEAFKTAQDMEAEQQALENAAPQDPNAVTTEPAPVN
ncbi:PRC-barrel domain-containing protein [Sulfitobacter sp. NFXS29]|uniref:PRC-barrel domain-containing protein n=1 Tax=Sulfitobacter sp. NFXS29 TaxID=2818438 RepID=UPI0032DE2D6D